MRYSSCKVQETDTLNVLNICDGLDGKGSDEGLPSCPSYDICDVQGGNGKGKKNNGSADTGSIRFVRKVFVFVLGEY